MAEGFSKTRLYGIWCAMKYRCYDKKSPSYKHYGGRGITICDEWKNNFQAFADWSLDHGYEDPPIDADKKWIAVNGLSIDRIDNNKGYSPVNCQWISWQENRIRHGKDLCGAVGSLGTHLKKARRGTGLSQIEVEQITGISHKSISNWETNVSRPSIENAIVLARLYNVTVDELIGA